LGKKHVAMLDGSEEKRRKRGKDKDDCESMAAITVGVIAVVSIVLTEESRGGGARQRRATSTAKPTQNLPNFNRV
jgi:hypothetical protein